LEGLDSAAQGVEIYGASIPIPQRHQSAHLYTSATRSTCTAFHLRRPPSRSRDDAGQGSVQMARVLRQLKGKRPGKVASTRRSHAGRKGQQVQSVSGRRSPLVPGEKRRVKLANLPPMV